MIRVASLPRCFGREGDYIERGYGATNAVVDTAVTPPKFMTVISLQKPQF